MSDDFLDPRLAERIARAARAAQTLSETLWEAIHEELSDPRAGRVVELSERLGEVAASVALLARAGAGAPERPAAPVERGVAPAEPGLAPPDPRAARAAHPEEPSSGATPPPGFSAARTPLSAAVLVDELAPDGERTTPPPAFVPAPVPAPAPPASFARGAGEIEIRDERGEHDRADAWIGAIARRLERHTQDGAPFAVLLVELVDGERLGRAEPGSETARLMSQVQDALARELRRPADALIPDERPGRYWLLVARTGRSGARMLAERLAHTVRSAASHRGTPLEVAVGVAVCPDDGHEVSALAAHADVTLYAARAAGRSVAET